MSQALVAVSCDLMAQAFARIEAAEKALAATRSASAAGRLYSDDRAIDGAVNTAWLKVKQAVDNCVRKGRAAVHEEVASFTQYMDDISKQLGAKAAEVRLRLAEKIRAMIRETLELALSAMRSEVQVGGRTYVLQTVDMEQKLVFSLSIEVSLTSLCELAGSGELTVTGAYHVQAPSV